MLNEDVIDHEASNLDLRYNDLLNIFTSKEELVPSHKGIIMLMFTFR